MARKRIITEAFVAKATKALKKKHATIHTVARDLKTSPSTIQRATGGKRAAEMGRRSAYLSQIEKAAQARHNASNRKSRKTAKRRAA
jgi:hypothetical protein